MTFGIPAFLFAFAALIIPLAIHLWSKDTQNQVYFGSIRFLQETVTKRTKTIFPSDLLLLLLRSLVLIVLALTLTEPFLLKEQVGTTTAYLIDPAIRNDLSRIKGSLPEDAAIFWLSETKSAASDSLQSYRDNLWMNFSSFDSYDSLVIFSHRNMSRFHGKRIRTNNKITWVAPPVDPPLPALTTISKKETNYAITENTNEVQTTFEWKETAKTGQPLDVFIYMHSSEKYQELANLVTAALKAIDENGLTTLHVQSSGDSPALTATDWMIWLDDDKPDWRKNLVYVGDNQQELIRKMGEGIYRIDGEAGTRKMLRLNLPLQLESILHEPFVRELEIADHRVLPESQIQATLSESPHADKRVTKTAIAWIGWLALVLLIMAERTLSNLKARR